MECITFLDDKEFSGFSPCPSPTIRPPPNSPSSVLGSPDKGRLALGAMITGNCVSRLRKSGPANLYEISSEEELTVSSADPKTPQRTATKKPLVCPAVNPFSWDLSQYGAIQKPIGMLSGMPLKEEDLWTFLHPSELSVIGPYAQLRRTMIILKRLFDLVQYTGARLVLESRGVPGRKPDWKLTAKIPVLSFGAATRLKSMSLWTSFVVESMSPIYCDGLIGIHAVLKSKDLPDLSVLQNFGLLAT